MRFVGHRGASARKPENTLAAFAAALRLGYAVECDFQLTSDGVPVVLHDDTLQRTAAVNISTRLATTPVGELLYDEVREVRVGDSEHDERLPTFRSVLELIEAEKDRPTTHLYAELKSDGEFASSAFAVGMPEATAREVRSVGVSPKHLSFISFSAGALNATRKLLPDYKYYLVARAETPVEAMDSARLAADSGFDGIDLNADALNIKEALVRFVHAREMKLLLWVWRHPATNDNQKMWDLMRSRKADVFTTNIFDREHLLGI